MMVIIGNGRRWNATIEGVCLKLEGERARGGMAEERD
jgi:hypothetical protein